MAEPHEAVFHVTCVYSNKPCEEHKKKLRILDKSVVKDVLLNLFDLPLEGDYIFQQFDTEFSDWIDTDNPSHFPTSAS